MQIRTSIALFIVCAVCLPGAHAYAAYLTGPQKYTLTKDRQKAQAHLERFQAKGLSFNAKSAEAQTNAEDEQKRLAGH